MATQITLDKDQSQTQKECPLCNKVFQKTEVFVHLLKCVSSFVEDNCRADRTSTQTTEPQWTLWKQFIETEHEKLSLLKASSLTIPYPLQHQLRDPNDGSRLVWYGSYGSNMFDKRFMCYIQGGEIEGMVITNRGCDNKNKPHKDIYYQTSHPLYFAKESITWGGGGVAFIHPDRNSASSSKNNRPNSTNNNNLTHMRLYLISERQFIQVVQQENVKMTKDEAALLDFEHIKTKGKQKIMKTWYGTILHLGAQDGCPIFTFTNERTITSVDDFNHPAESYISVIRKGLIQMQFSDAQVFEYLSQKGGVDAAKLQQFFKPHLPQATKAKSQPKVAKQENEPQTEGLAANPAPN